ncbi:flavin-containing monooxygenase [Nevskia ramosa]|uniref:flavin-containing monooxygenase n=1 Tax=Nevskia ramosa TaxID=64002 RepID=UPI002354F73E
MNGKREPRVIIIGAGMSGMLMAIKLIESGMDNFQIYDKASEIGGTWRENTYPGIGCDVAAHYYTYQDVPNPEWSTRLPQGAEIQKYLLGVAEQRDLRRRIAFNKEVARADHDGQRWTVRFEDGEVVEADFVVACCGLLHHPRYPDIPGLGDFKGAKFHSARWDHSVPLEGRRVGVIGNGSTGAQIISKLSERKLDLKVFQRTPQWIFPLPDRRYSQIEKSLLRAFPWVGRIIHHVYRVAFENLFAAAVLKPCWQRRLMSWLCKWNLNTVKDPALRAKLTPDYQPLCKRLVMSMEFYPAIQRENVSLVTDEIDHIDARGVVTKDGVLHEVDVLALATGFDAHAYFRPLELRNVQGRTLSEAWKQGPYALRTVAVPGFPNFFFTLGPQSPIGNFSAISISETQINYILRCIEMFRDGKFRTLHPTPEATEKFNAFIRAAMPDTIWVTGCTNWYMSKNGVPSAWPYSGNRFRKELREPNLAEYELAV